MKKKLLTLMLLALLALSFTATRTDLAKAEELPPLTGDGSTDDSTGEVQEAPPVSYITISQMPAKLTYARGESLDLTGMVVQGYYFDGTSSEIADYQVIGFDSNLIGSQTVIILYQNQMAAFSVNVIPAKVTNVTLADHNTASYTLTWDAVEGAARYDVYELDELTGTYTLVNFTFINSITFYNNPGTVHTYKICSVEYLLGVEYRSELSDPCIGGTNPDMVTALTVTGTTTTSISLSWPAVNGATGYLIYRSPAASESYVLVGTADTAAYTDSKLKSGQSYKYKVSAYVYNDTFSGLESPIADTSTNPAKVNLKYKAGDQKVRFTWTKVNGATSYDIYIGDEINGFTILKTFVGDSTSTYIAEGLITGNTYTFYAVAHRKYKGVIYDSPASDKLRIPMVELEPTSTTGKLFLADENFMKSWAYKKLPFFRTYVDYSKSYIIPGLITTNVGGFSSINMCPQGITFAGEYLLMSAYDMKGEENSVIYVIDKATEELLTTIILPSKPHAGGLAYDGYNVWVTNGSKVSSILFSDIEVAAASGEPYVYVDYNSVNPLNITTSYVTYYDNKLWVGTYNELQSTKMYSYIIDNKESSPTLTKADTIIMPTRVQGVAFTKKGTLIISRSCQLYKGLRGYIRQLDTYKPDFESVVDGVIPLGDLVNSVNMPSMNEGIAIDGAYLYVNFESAAFDNASYRMDRICAFKLTDVAIKKTT